MRPSNAGWKPGEKRDEGLRRGPFYRPTIREGTGRLYYRPRPSRPTSRSIGTGGQTVANHFWRQMPVTQFRLPHGPLGPLFSHAACVGPENFSPQMEPPGTPSPQLFSTACLYFSLHFSQRLSPVFTHSLVHPSALRQVATSPCATGELMSGSTAAAAARAAKETANAQTHKAPSA